MGGLVAMTWITFNVFAIRLKKMLADKSIVYVLACTELSLLKEYLKEYIIVDAMDILVLKTIEKLGYQYKK